jgi:hypothetical protein
MFVLKSGQLAIILFIYRSFGLDFKACTRSLNIITKSIFLTKIIVPFSSDLHNVDNTISFESEFFPWRYQTE